MWGATGLTLPQLTYQIISIHAPRVGSDGCGSGADRKSHDFNPRSPCGERPYLIAKSIYLLLFQSTLPVWGATASTYKSHRHRPNFNPRSPCGERPSETATARSLLVYFNPRSPCGERRATATVQQSGGIFQSTLPVWGATPKHAATRQRSQISIHAPRVGSDRSSMFSKRTINYFNPRSPCGERLRLGPSSTYPRDFNPRSPCGERLSPIVCVGSTGRFQSTLPVWGATIFQAMSAQN